MQSACLVTLSNWGLSRKQEAEFLLRDLEEALAYEPTAKELGESVIDLTGDVTSQSAPTVVGAFTDRPSSSHKRLRTNPVNSGSKRSSRH